MQNRTYFNKKYSLTWDLSNTNDGECEKERERRRK